MLHVLLLFVIGVLIDVISIIIGIIIIIIYMHLCFDMDTVLS
jgi:hypothetical protein